VDTTLDKVVGVLDHYGLLALIPGAVGVWVAARKAKAAKAARADAEEANGNADILADAVREIVTGIEQLPAEVHQAVTAGQSQSSATEDIVKDALKGKL